MVENHLQNLALVLAEIQDSYAVQCHIETAIKKMGLDIQASTKISQR
jgi:hypothetical protein